MTFRKLGVVLAAAVLAVLAMGAWTSHGATRTVSAGGDPVAVIQGFIDAVNAVDADAAASFFAEDGYITEPQEVDGGSIGVFGRPAIAFAYQGLEGQGLNVTLIRSEVAGTTVTGVVELTSDEIMQAGVDRFAKQFTAEVVDGKIASIVLTYDETDPQTATYIAYVIAYVRSHPEEDEGPPPEEFAEVTISGDQQGGAFVGDFGGGVMGLFVEIEPGPEGAWQPSGIHEGTCDDLGELAQPLAFVVDGGGSSFITGDFDHLLDEPHAIAVAASTDDLTIVACGNIEAPAEEPTVAPTARPTVVLPNTGTGGAAGSNWLLVALVAAGAAGIAGFGALRMARR